MIGAQYRIAIILCFVSIIAGARADSTKPFAITVLDEETGRGVPLVELETVNNLRYVTDSNGVVAFHEPGLMGQRVFFYARSHGYEFPKDGFGFRGQALDVTEGGSAVMKIKRINLAERLYRVTGAGIYADSVRAGMPVAVRQPLLNGQVLGSDSVVNAVYGGKLRWFWGDTNRPGYPLGNFHVPGAMSDLPGKGGLDPETGVDLTYFVDEKGFAKPTCQMPGDGPTWIFGLIVLNEKGRERMFAAYMKVRGYLNVYEHGLAEWKDRTNQFDKVTAFPNKAPAYPGGHPILQRDNGVEYVYFPQPFPLLRVKADVECLKDLTKYEAYTCLEDGEPDRDANGSLRWSWRANAAPLGQREQARLIRDRKMKPGEALIALRDIESGKPVQAPGGSVYWNDYRQRWVMIFVEGGGTSPLGEVWYAEADALVGPWVYARKIVTHDRYSFYNPKQHPLFDKDGGRVIFFEGTYSHTFSGNPNQTPRYDYNQIMYKLDLGSPKLTLPAPVYILGNPERPTAFGFRPEKDDLMKKRAIAFFALDRPGVGTVGVFDRGGQLQASGDGKSTLFHALPADTPKPPPGTVPLFEFVNGNERAYTIDKNWTRAGFQRVEKPLCLVWAKP